MLMQRHCMLLLNALVLLHLMSCCLSHPHDAHLEQASNSLQNMTDRGFKRRDRPTEEGENMQESNSSNVIIGVVSLVVGCGLVIAGLVAVRYRRTHPLERNPVDKQSQETATKVKAAVFEAVEKQSEPLTVQRDKDERDSFTYSDRSSTFIESLTAPQIFSESFKGTESYADLTDPSDTCT